MNRLYYGDCLTIMQDWPLQSVDLIYLDPPFNSNRQYNSIYKDETGRPLPDQIEAFCDMWELDAERERAIRTMPVLMRDSGLDDSVAELWKLWMQALRGTQPRLLAYLSYMAQRLLIMKRILKPNGSIYYHCDPTASHYIKALMDAVFGHDNFRSDITWQRTGAHNDAKRYGAIVDHLLFYTKSAKWTWNQQYTKYTEEYIRERYHYIEEGTGRRFWPNQMTGAGQGTAREIGGQLREPPRGRHWAYTQEDISRLETEGRIYWSKRELPYIKNYLAERKGRPLQNIWTDIAMTKSGAERMGYATQKPVALLERIIQASSNPGDVVLDPFCGCATTIEAAHKLDRQWIGIDIAIHAIKRVTRLRLQDRLGLMEGQDFTIDGIPSTLEGAVDLWTKDKYHFQQWAVEQADGFVTTKRTADGGVDGRIYFAVPDTKELQSMTVEVKGGVNVTIESLRALKGVLDYDNALMAGLIIREPLGAVKARNFNRFMADAGTIELWGNEYPKMQILTIEELLEGKRFATPTVVGRHTQSPRMPGLPA